MQNNLWKQVCITASHLEKKVPFCCILTLQLGYQSKSKIAWKSWAIVNVSKMRETVIQAGRTTALYKV